MNNQQRKALTVLRDDVGEKLIKMNSDANNIDYSGGDSTSERQFITYLSTVYDKLDKLGQGDYS